MILIKYYMKAHSTKFFDNLLLYCGNIFASSLLLRKSFLELGLFERIVEIINKIDTSQKTIKLSLWLITILIKEKPYPNYEIVF